MADVEAGLEVAETPEAEAREAEQGDSAAQQGDGSDDEEEQSSEEDESDAEPAAVLTRERRSNAGNRYSKLLAAEERADADAAEGEFYTAEGWQEVADDQAFSGSEAEAPDDISLHSSSSDDEDDDEGAEDQGEKELRKQERAEQAGKTKKRKTMQDVYKPRPLKKPRVAASAAAALSKDSADGSAPRPKKKSERVSWIPAEGEGPQRQSSRKLAVENKVRVHERLEKAEKHRLRTLAIMQAADQRKAAAKAEKMTQEEHLAEAMRIEKKNAKSLNRWEESERIKEEERKEKLAAMKNRKLEGPFVRFWSGQCVWCADKIRHIGKGGKVQEIEEKVNLKEQEKFKKAQERERLEREAQLLAAANANSAVEQPDDAVKQQPETPSQTQPLQPPEQRPPTYPDTIMFPPPQSAGFLEGIHDWASQPGLPQQPAQHNHFATPHTITPATPNNPTSGNAILPLPLPPNQPTATPAPQPPPHYNASLAMHSLVLLENFKELAEPAYHTAKSRAKDKEEKDKNTISNNLLGFHAPPKGTKYAVAHAPELCEITSRQARYRDPVTGLAYADSYAYKCIRRLVGGACEWSNLLGAFAGPSGDGGMGRPANGVPDVFVRKVTDVATLQKIV